MAILEKWTNVQVDTVESNHFVEKRHMSLKGVTAYDPSPGSHFVLYREDGKIMRTSRIEESTPTDTGWEFRTRNTKYKLTWLPPTD